VGWRINSINVVLLNNERRSSRFLTQRPGSHAAIACVPRPCRGRADVVGVLIEVPVMLLVVRVVNRSRGWYERA
jgi:hypothetical protein